MGVTVEGARSIWSDSIGRELEAPSIVPFVGSLWDPCSSLRCPLAEQTIAARYSYVGRLSTPRTMSERRLKAYRPLATRSSPRSASNGSRLCINALKRCNPA